MNLQPLKWTQSNGMGVVTHTAESPLHSYIIRYDELERAYLIDYFERMTGEHGSEFFKSADEAKSWAQSTHYRDKMQPYVRPDSITDIANWFKKAKPEPTTKDICTQIGCHFEEVAEMHLSLGDSKMCHLTDQNANDYKQGYTNAIVGMMVREHGGLSKIELLDALCDQIVTATGVAYMMGFDMEGALKEVVRSNNSKMVDGKFEFDDNGKIMKPDSYSKPDLTKFVEVTK